MFDKQAAVAELRRRLADTAPPPRAARPAPTPAPGAAGSQGPGPGWGAGESGVVVAPSPLDELLPWGGLPRGGIVSLQTELPQVGHVQAGHLPAGTQRRGYPLTGHQLTGHQLTGHQLTGHQLTGHQMTGHRLNGQLQKGHQQTEPQASAPGRLDGDASPRPGASRSGLTTLLFTLLAGPVKPWSALVGFGDLGMAAAAELGVDLSRTVLIPDPGVDLTQILSVLVDGLDVVVVHAPQGPVGAPGRQRVLASRLRQRGVVLVAVGPWPGADLSLTVSVAGWTGLGAGHGRLQDRELVVRLAGRRIGGQEAELRLLLTASRIGARDTVRIGRAVPAALPQALPGTQPGSQPGSQPAHQPENQPPTLPGTVALPAVAGLSRAV